MKLFCTKYYFFPTFVIFISKNYFYRTSWISLVNSAKNETKCSWKFSRNSFFLDYPTIMLFILCMYVSNLLEIPHKLIKTILCYSSCSNSVDTSPCIYLPSSKVYRWTKQVFTSYYFTICCTLRGPVHCKKSPIKFRPLDIRSFVQIGYRHGFLQCVLLRRQLHSCLTSPPLTT